MKKLRRGTVLLPISFELRGVVRRKGAIGYCFYGISMPIINDVNIPTNSTMLLGRLAWLNGCFIVKNVFVILVPM